MQTIGLLLNVPVISENFSEPAYLAGNPDVAAAVRDGRVASGRSHFDAYGFKEGRSQRISTDEAFLAAKARKLDQIRPLLRKDMQHIETPDCFDFLTPELRAQAAIIGTEAVSSNQYDSDAMDLIHKHRNGLILDCGSGRRSVYFDHVVNFEVVPYDTTDVQGVGEVLPFADASFDAVLSLAVLEHVRDPFSCAREIARVLKPKGDLMCCVAFLQPVHGYPNHFYNMTAQGVKNLFPDELVVDRVAVSASVLPIWSLTWILRSWAEGLSGAAKQEFLNLRVEDILDSGDTYVERPFVKELPPDKNLELASATVLFGRKAG